MQNNKKNSKLASSQLSLSHGTKRKIHPHTHTVLTAIFRRSNEYKTENLQMSNKQSSNQWS